MNQPTEKVSNLERYRSEQKQQVDARRAGIITAAKRLFLSKGLEKTSMRDIAEEAHINRVTLYRYFPDRHPLAFEVAGIMIKEIMAATSPFLQPKMTAIAAVRELFLQMIRHFDSLQDAYRYLGMFDQIYARAYPSEELGAWYKEMMFAEFYAATSINQEAIDDETLSQVIMLGNVIFSFLEKMAARGDLLSAEQGVSIEIQLKWFEALISRQLDLL